ncbi:hypothetical protein SK128_026724 [Halocaridina rubra]|uniref:Uncharacterized protein n=1 Tax=Halocaridina rubra TaxID=373956 RepID=A0AAN9ADM1_HALRR
MNERKDEGVVIFCDEECRLQYLSEDHWLECVLLPTLLAIEMPCTNLPYKILKSFNHEEIKTMVKELRGQKQDKPESAGCSAEGIYKPSSYETVHYLCQNKEQTTSQYLYVQAQHAFVITKLLHKSGRYFIDGQGATISPERQDLISTGALLLSHILRMECNQHTVYDEKVGTKYKFVVTVIVI